MKELDEEVDSDDHDDHEDFDISKMKEFNNLILENAKR